MKILTYYYFSSFRSCNFKGPVRLYCTMIAEGFCKNRHYNNNRTCTMLASTQYYTISHDYTLISIYTMHKALTSVALL